MDSKIIDILNNSSSYSSAEKLLQNVMVKGKLSKEEIKIILSLDEKLIVSAFLEQYNYFDEEDIQYIGEYIRENLNHSNRMFVSDLIEFANYWEIEIPYVECIEFLKKYEDDNWCVQSASIDYIFENLKFQYIKEIVGSLKEILNDTNQNLSVQVKTAFVLFRITMKKEYLEDLTDLVITENHQEQLKNILSRDYNKQEYFDYYQLLEFIAENKK
jgi:hypothetical protein